MSIRKILIAIPLLAISATSFAAPHESEQDNHRHFKKERAGFIKKFDTDKDGKLSETEFKALELKMEEKRKERFSKLDSNGDGSISLDEFKDKKKSFSDIDKNNDGFLDKSELKKAKKRAKHNKEK